MTPEDRSKDESISVFISHRHIDKALADAFREEIQDWCGDRTAIYQSSSAENASKIGTRLDLAIGEAISQANLVLLIYTDAPGDYDWCMYECGLAQDPASLESNIAVFFTTEDLPEPMDNRIGIRLTQESIQKLVYDFHCTPEFFARRAKPYQPQETDEQIREKADRLYKKLKAVAPSLSADVTVYDRITLGLGEELVDQIRASSEESGQKAAFELAQTLVSEHAIVRSYSGDPQEHFNFDTFKDSMSAGELFKRWNQDNGEDVNKFWQQELCHAIGAAVLNRPERSIKTPFKSLSDSQWLLPLLARFRFIPYEDIYEFDILFCKLESDVATRMLST